MPPFLAWDFAPYSGWVDWKYLLVATTFFPAY